MATKREKDVIRRFAEAYNAEVHTSYQVVAWPDEEERTGKAIDALASDGEATLAIEHTLLQPFAGERKDTAVFLQTVGKLDKAPHLMLPGLAVSVSVDVGAVPKGVNWSAVAPAVEKWYLSVGAHLPNGRSRQTIPDLPFKLEANVDRKAVNHPRGFFFIDRVMPAARPLIETVQQALNTKVDKLTAANADRRILLLENDVPIFGHGEVGELLERLLPQFPKLARVDEVWIANTTALESENYFSIDLVWPLDAAEERDEARNATD